MLLSSLRLKRPCGGNELRLAERGGPEDEISMKVPCTEVEVFLDKRVCEMCQTAGANSRRGATKKRKISWTLLSINLHFSVVYLSLR